MDNDSIRTPTVTPTATTTYTAVIADPNGCASSDEVTVTVNPKPSVSISGDTIACLGNSIQLAADFGTSNITAFTWTSTLGFNNTTQTTVSVSTDANGYLHLVGNQ